ncbi:hypothetical protein [Cellulomonas septica]|uniref:Uncharacterized protein n=1 Tax=Cellulomonas septica TaxID=285080 RepID=A0ABX1K0A3_9CELL|nr:hypothetical protein [Cellulomonas septica]NKY40001.1 hypothetical protein [Cellulomonas septica]
MRRTRTLTAAAAALLTAGAALAGAAPASAAPTLDLVVQKNGVWKGYASVNGSTGRLCVRAYHSTPGAVAVANVWYEGQLLGRVSDPGGDSEPTCGYTRTDPGYWAGLELLFHPETGSTLRAYDNFFFPR